MYKCEESWPHTTYVHVDRLVLLQNWGQESGHNSNSSGKIWENNSLKSESQLCIRKESARWQLGNLRVEDIAQAFSNCSSTSFQRKKKSVIILYVEIQKQGSITSLTHPKYYIPHIDEHPETKMVLFHELRWNPSIQIDSIHYCIVKLIDHKPSYTRCLTCSNVKNVDTGTSVLGPSPRI